MTSTRLPAPRALLRAAAARRRKMAYLGGRHLGAPCLLLAPDEVARVELRGDDDDGGRVRALLAALDEAVRGLHGDDVCLFLLGYEASAALDPLAPRRGRDPSLGPDAWVRVYRAGVRGEGEPFGSSSEVAAVASSALDDDDGDDDEDARATVELSLPPGARERHVGRVARCIEELYAGTLYQANLAHRLDVAPRTAREAASFFLARTAGGEPPFAAFVDDDEGTLVSLSPERFLTFDLGARRAASYPIKGTRPRGESPADDERLLAELCASEKDAAEHVMIVDLLRNDLGRVAVTGGVTVTALMRPLSVRNVHHLESEIVAELRPDVTLGALLEATAPGGSITGAPKSAALDVICALEGGPRGPYTGVLGAVDARGRGVASLLIRTWVRADDGEGALHVGGGIVVGSDPEGEWRETLDKAAAFGAVVVGG